MANLEILIPTAVVVILIVSLLLFIFRRKLRFLICNRSLNKDVIESADFNIELDSFLPSETTTRFRVEQQCEWATVTEDTYNQENETKTKPKGLVQDASKDNRPAAFNQQNCFDEASKFELVIPNCAHITQLRSAENDKKTPHPNSHHRLPPDDEMQLFQNSLRGNTNQLDIVRRVQKLWLEKRFPDSSDSSTQCKLIIGVDATPRVQAGYCINLEEKSLHFYVVKRNHLPWTLHNLKDASEFEMKNLMFALTVWNGDILKYKRIRVYTDNFAVGWESGRYGCRAGDLIRHYENCEAVTIMNKNNIAVNKYKNLKYFAKFIQPADDLSRWKITEAVEFLKKLYGIEDENIYGTHIQKNHGPTHNTWYEPTQLYEELRKKVDNVISTPLCNDSNCARILQKSLQNIYPTANVTQTQTPSLE